jgi:ribose transport system substrate-binding protein
VQQAQAAIAAVTGPFRNLTPSGPPFDARKYTVGKTAGLVMAMSTDPGFQIALHGLQQGMAALGMKLSLCDGQDYSIPAETRCIQLFTNEHLNVILLSAVTPSQVAAPIAAAAAAGIPVVSSNSVVEGAPMEKNIAGQIALPYTHAATLMADAAIAMSNGHANVMVINSSDYVTSPPMAAAIKATFTKYCPGCTVTYPDVPIADWATQLVPLVENAVHQNPNLQYILPLYDTELPIIDPALKAANATNRVKIISMPGTYSLIPFIGQPGNPYAVAIGSSEVQSGYAWADDAARLLAGERNTPALLNAQIGIRVFDKANVATLNLKDSGSWFGNFSIPGFYAKQWEISS